MKKLRMVEDNSLTFEEGCNKYLDNCRARNLRDFMKEFGVKIESVIAIGNLKSKRTDGLTGEEYISNKYGTTIHTLISDEDIRSLYQ